MPKQYESSPLKYNSFLMKILVRLVSSFKIKVILTSLFTFISNLLPIVIEFRILYIEFYTFATFKHSICCITGLIRDKNVQEVMDTFYLPMSKGSHRLWSRDYFIHTNIIYLKKLFRLPRFFGEIITPILMNFGVEIL